MTSFTRHPSTVLFFTLALAVALTASVLALMAGPRVVAEGDPRLALPPLQAPGEWFDSQRSIDGSAVNYGGALETAAELRAEAIGGEWTNLGPTNIGGRINDVVTDADDQSVVYAAAASGGVWRGTGYGTEWSRAWPDDLTQAIGSLGRNGDLLLAGSGEANPGGGSIVYGGTGAYVSSDDGGSWDLIGLTDSGAIGRVFAHGDGFLIGATGNLFVPGGQRGLYRWAPGMDQPELLLDGNDINATTGVVDIAVDPADDNHIIVATWDHSRSPDARLYSGPGSGLWSTYDGGQTWTRNSEVTMPDANENGRMAVAFAPSDPSRVYAEIANVANGTHGAFFVSNDGGATFEVRPSPAALRSTNSSYGWWFGRIYVDPANANKLFVMGLNLTASSNGGQSFSTASSTPHSDNHSMVWDTREEGLVYLGNDGGVYTSTDNGSTYTQSLQQGWTQHYSVDVADVGSGDQIVTGLQDNGCIVNYTGTAGDWQNNGLCGDGLESIFMPGNPTISWSCSQYGGCSRNVLGAPDLGLISFPRGSNRWGWLADIEFEPGTSTTLYTGSQFLWKSTNGGTTWTNMSGDLSSDPEQLDPNPGYRLRGVITSIAPGHQGDRVWVGTDEGLLWNIDAGNGDATPIENDALPTAWITSVTTAPESDSVAYVAYSGFRQGGDASHVFATTDGGTTFTDLSGNLPNAPVNDLIVVGDQLIAATDTGVYVRDRTSADHVWHALGTNLPSVPVIQVDHEFGVITAATFGHGIQRIDLPGATSGPINPLATP